MDNGDSPATKQGLLQLEERLKKHLSELEQRLREHVSDTETKLLRAFFNWAEVTQKRFDQLDRADHAPGERSSATERWLLEIQKRLEELSRQRPPQ